MADNVNLPESAELAEFRPVAYYDKHMDCIRVLTHDRSVTEHRLNGIFTVFECNHRGQFDPMYVGFSIKGVRHIFAEVGLDLDGVYTVAEIITRIVSHKPGTGLAVMLDLIFQQHQAAGDLRINMAGEAAKKAA